jgi:hypothetical protein
MPREVVDITVKVLHRTARAVLVTDSTEEEGVWLPLSQMEIEPAPRAGYHIVTLPEWLAQEKGLI